MQAGENPVRAAAGGVPIFTKVVFLSKGVPIPGILLRIKRPNSPAQSLIAAGQGKGQRIQGEIKVSIQPVSLDIRGKLEARLAAECKIKHAGGIVRNQNIGSA